ncbi:polysaccharide deacetylase family protein [Aliiroseovarius subalbicans]|uniref:polysaccharide deacetylase family protein n=1 Tax=Aliiroseovarius subalbicans TaxID=2925840 RepID=UPI001F598A77|nr:polysaccharide deacetylase family protein [Aliiroseovarius subalbicans]MCI2399911.1 glycosyltransferase [Aliiroseovarius subalbicans]
MRVTKHEKNAKKTEGKSSIKPIFFDPTSHRLVFLTLFSGIFLILVLVWFFLFISHLYNAELPDISAETTSASSEGAPADAPHLPSRWTDEPATTSPTAPGSNEMPDVASDDTSPNGEVAAHRVFPNTTVHAFIPAWSIAGLAETRANFAAVDVLLPEWFSISPSSDDLVSLQSPHREKLRELWLQDRFRVELFPVARVEFSKGDESAPWLTSAQRRMELIKAASSLVLEEAFDGLCFDFAGAAPKETEAIAAFSLELKNAFESVGKESCIISAIDSALFEHSKIADMAHRFIGLAFQEPGPFSGPTPLAAQHWYEDNLNEILSRLPAEKLVIALGSFGMDWISGQPNPEYLNFFDITEAVALNNGSIEMDRTSLNSRASFLDDRRRRHQVWFLDALSAHNQLTRAPLDRIGGVAIWPVTGTDPGFWELLSPALPSLNTTQNLLPTISPAAHVKYTGKGPLLTVQNTAVPGRRVLTTDPESGLIIDANYLELPRAFTVALNGALPSNTVVLTFDDGPSKEYTPQILDILKEYDVPAVFFVVGSRVLKSPDIARRIVEDGHELGVHTYSHPNIAKISDLRLKLELHASQELIESVTGTNTHLFRAPYGFDENPETPKEAGVLNLLTNERYVVVGIEIDSTDWTRPGAEKIAETVTSLVQSGQGNVVLLHDAGGDREQTILALPKIIEALREMGISFVPLSSITEQNGGFQPGTGAQDQDQISTYSFWVIRSLENALTAAFFFLITVGIARSLTVLVLALIKEKRPHKSGDAVLPVTVLIPAFCEEAVIVKSVTSVLQSTYPIDEVVVIDDGSTDETAKVVRDHFGSDPRVRLIQQDNQGKAEALNAGIRSIDTPVFVAIDADTLIAPEAIGLLVRHFNDETVGAVAGNVKVGNRQNALTRLQAIEYITAQNLDRRAFEVLNGIMVVPGSIGAWRTQAVRESGGYTTQTLVEDADLTVSIVRRGLRVVFEPKAHAFTEAPETIPQWMRQRLRWHFGMLQIAWKHKSAFFERRAMGMISIPDLVLHGAVFSLFAPIADIVMVVNLFALFESFTASPQVSAQSSHAIVAGAYIAYLLSDFVLATIAFSLEPTESKRLLPWVLTQRFFYRQIYWMVALRSIARVATGRFTGWRKITRTSSVKSANTLGLSRDQARIVSTNKVAPKPPN